MKKYILSLSLLFASIGMIGCTPSQVGTTVGAASGAGIGYAVSGGSPVATVVGAGAGGLLGYAVGRSQERRVCYYRGRYYYC